MYPVPELDSLSGVRLSGHDGSKYVLHHLKLKKRIAELISMEVRLCGETLTKQKDWKFEFATPPTFTNGLAVNANSSRSKGLGFVPATAKKIPVFLPPHARWT